MEERKEEQRQNVKKEDQEHMPEEQATEGMGEKAERGQENRPMGERRRPEETQ